MPTCEMHKDHPADTEMPTPMFLEHFLNCLPQQEQHERMQWWRDEAGAGFRCRMHNHAQIIQSQRELIVKMRSELTGLISEGSRDGAHIREQLQKLLVS